MTDSTRRSSVPPPRGRCVRCGYDLRGRDSDVCPECGTSTSIPIGIPGSAQFHLARAALEREGLLVRYMNPGGALGTIGVLYGGDHGSPGYLWVDPRDEARVESCLTEAGVAWEFGALPIVDRSEPQCPNCENALDPEGPEHCPRCGAAFQWVEIETTEASPDGESCRCGYELRGLAADGNCPECGRDIAAQLGPAEPHMQGDSVAAEPRTPTAAPHPGTDGWQLPFIMVTVTCTGAVVAMIDHGADAIRNTGVILWITGVLGLILLAIMRHNPRR